MILAIGSPGAPAAGARRRQAQGSSVAAKDPRIIRPDISRLTSFNHPIGLTAGMPFAGETCCRVADGISAARIEVE